MIQIQTFIHHLNIALGYSNPQAQASQSGPRTNCLSARHVE